MIRSAAQIWVGVGAAEAQTRKFAPLGMPTTVSVLILERYSRVLEWMWKHAAECRQGLVPKQCIRGDTHLRTSLTKRVRTRSPTGLPDMLVLNPHMHLLV